MLDRSTINYNIIHDRKRKEKDPLWQWNDWAQHIISSSALTGAVVKIALGQTYCNMKYQRCEHLTV